MIDHLERVRLGAADERGDQRAQECPADRDHAHDGRGREARAHVGDLLDELLGLGDDLGVEGDLGADVHVASPLVTQPCQPQPSPLSKTLGCSESDAIEFPPRVHLGFGSTLSGATGPLAGFANQQSSVDAPGRSSGPVKNSTV